MNILIKIFLISASVILLILGGFSLYKILNKNTNQESVTITANPTSTITPQFIADNNLPTQTPSKALTPTGNTTTPTIFPKEINITPTSTSIPLKTPTLNPSITPTRSPTPTILPTLKPSPSPTQSQQEKLPVAGYSAPTLILLTLGFILFLPLMLL